MSRYTHTFCDCCGREITGRIDIGEPELFVTMIVGKYSQSHYCFDCARYCLDAWAKETRRIRDEKLVEVKQ